MSVTKRAGDSSSSSSKRRRMENGSRKKEEEDHTASLTEWWSIYIENLLCAPKPRFSPETWKRYAADSIGPSCVVVAMDVGEDKNVRRIYGTARVACPPEGRNLTNPADWVRTLQFTGHFWTTDPSVHVWSLDAYLSVPFAEPGRIRFMDDYFLKVGLFFDDVPFHAHTPNSFLARATQSELVRLPTPDMLHMSRSQRTPCQPFLLPPKSVENRKWCVGGIPFAETAYIDWDRSLALSLKYYDICAFLVGTWKRLPPNLLSILMDYALPGRDAIHEHAIYRNWDTPPTSSVFELCP